jgi:lipopolysaccharide transport system permease protein
MISESVDAPYELRIRPNRSWIRFDWIGVWEYRDLLFLLVRRDFISRYKQTVLGPAWFVIQPLLTTMVFTVLFGNVARMPTDGLPPMLFYLCGMQGWTYFANTFNTTSTTFTANSGLFGKVYFPRVVVPLSTVVSNLFAFAIQLATLLVFWMYFKYFTAAGAHFGMRWVMLALPLLIVQIGALSLGAGLWMSALTAKYRDFAQLSGFLVQIWMYATPVIFPLSLIPEKWRYLVVLNPMTMPVEGMKYMFLGQGDIDPFYFSISVIVTVAMFFSGLGVFQKVERTFVDSV